MGVLYGKIFAVNLSFTAAFRVIWAQVILACVEGSLGRRVQTPQLSAYTVQKAILAEYQENKRFPEGLSAVVPSVRDWALRCGAILKKCVRSSAFFLYGMKHFHDLVSLRVYYTLYTALFLDRASGV